MNLKNKCQIGFDNTNLISSRSGIGNFGNVLFRKKYAVLQNLIYGPECSEFEFSDIKL